MVKTKKPETKVMKVLYNVKQVLKFIVKEIVPFAGVIIQLNEKLRK